MERVTMQKRMAQEPAGVALTTNKQRRTLLVCPGAMQNREGKLAVERRSPSWLRPAKNPARSPGRVGIANREFQLTECTDFDPPVKRS
jgi:hypothetical protein